MVVVSCKSRNSNPVCSLLRLSVASATEDVSARGRVGPQPLG